MVTLPVTCRQLAYLILIGLFVVGIALLLTVNFDITTDNGFFGWLLTGFAIVFGIIAIVIEVTDRKLIRCKCDKS